jgi:hypothetical protein
MVGSSCRRSCHPGHLLTPYVLLAGVFLIGVGFAFNAPAWTAIQPEIVSNYELPSAATLGGLQLNISGIYRAGNRLFTIALDRRKPCLRLKRALLLFIDLCNCATETKKGAIESTAGELSRIVYHSNTLRSLRSRHSGGLGAKHSVCVLYFRDPGIARSKFSSNSVTILANVLVAVVFLLMAVVRDPQLFLVAAGLAGSLDHGGFRALGCRPARDAELGARSHERHCHYGSSVSRSARRNNLGNLGGHVGNHSNTLWCGRALFG